MKRIYIILSTVLLLVVTSCNYLDVTPPGKVIPDKVSEYRALMTSAYRAFPVYKNLLTVRTDELLLSSDEQVRDGYLDIAIWNDVTPDSKTLSYPWINFYQTIFYANSVIRDVMGATSDGDLDTREELMAEALLLRAYCHFELLNLYAKPYDATTASTDRGIPVATDIDVEQDYVPATIEKVYEQIFADLEEGQRLIEQEVQPENIRYRFSKKAAKALESRIRLYRSEWEKALEVAESILPQCVLTDLNDASAELPWVYTSEESILALEQIGNRDLNGMVVAPAFMAKYAQDGDLRLGKSFQWENNQYIPSKTSNENTVRVTFRSGEIYLIAAEAAAHVNGKLDVAKTYLKELLVKRLTATYFEQRGREIDAMDQTTLLGEIMEERARELALEGHRWYDLRRTTRPEIVKSYMDRTGKQQQAVLLKDDTRYVLRFPKEAIQNNPNLNDQ